MIVNQLINAGRLFLEIVRKHINMKELTHEIVREFIDHIVVHHAENIGGEKVQRIEIYYNCIGEVAAPKIDELPRARIRMGTRKGVAINYSSSDKATSF